MLGKIKKYISKQFIFPEVHIPVSEDLSEKVVIVTGSSKGIGKAIAEILLKKGAKVVVVSRHKTDLEKEFLRFKDSVLICEADVTQESGASLVVNETLTKWGRVDVLVNNAGTFIEKSIEELSVDDYDTMMNLNVKAAYLMTKHVVPNMKHKGSGLIINIGSKISHNPQIGANKAVYAASKFAIEGLSLALNRELKPFGIRVSCLMPGTVNTFVSLKSAEFLSPYHVADIISLIIRHDDIDFESLVIKSKKQNI